MAGRKIHNSPAAVIGVPLKEPLENLSGGTEPKQMLMILEDDLVDKLNPGDKVRITGTLKTFREERSGKFKNYIYVNHIEPLEQEFEELQLSEEDEEQIIELSKDPNIYDKIIKSTAPSIRGYRDVKEAIALQLFGGAAKQLEDETEPIIIKRQKNITIKNNLSICLYVINTSKK